MVISPNGVPVAAQRFVHKLNTWVPGAGGALTWKGLNEILILKTKMLKWLQFLSKSLKILQNISSNV